MIEVSHLTKMYGNHAAVKDLSFSVEKGIIYGFLGPNGAGKSTTMNIITGCLGATEGEVTIDGHSITEEPLEAKKRIGYLPELPPLYPEMTPLEYLRFVAEAKGIARKERDEKVNAVMERTGIAHMRSRLIKNLSKGYRQRVGIAQALLGDPEVIILDEPTVGLDPAQIIEIRDLIRSLRQEHTVILSSHILSEVQAVCDNILIISDGQLVACDMADNLQKMADGKTLVSILVKGEQEKIEALLEKEEDVESYEYKTSTEEGALLLAVTAKDDKDIREKLFFAFAEEKLPLLEMKTERASLEEVFLELTGEKEFVADTEEAAEEEAPEEEATEETKGGEEA